jgi:hypothetical protein
MPDFYNAYHRLPEKETLPRDTESRRSSRPLRPLLALLLAAAMFGLYRTALSGGLRLGCASRNLATATKQLPTHYTLPSGDKIPSVALGTAASSVCIRALLAR